MIRRAYDADNERAILKFNGPYRLPPFGPSFNGVISPQGVQTTKVIKLGSVKIYGIPQKADKVNV